MKTTFKTKINYKTNESVTVSDLDKRIRGALAEPAKSVTMAQFRKKMVAIAKGTGA